MSVQHPTFVCGKKLVPLSRANECLALATDLRDGVEDYELLRLAERHLGRAAVLRMIRPTFVNAGSWTRDADTLLAADAERVWADAEAKGFREPSRAAGALGRRHGCEYGKVRHGSCLQAKSH